jgi:hypothetical protein
MAMNFAVALSLVMAILAVVSVFIEVPFISDYAFWVAVVAYIILAQARFAGDRRERPPPDVPLCTSLCANLCANLRTSLAGHALILKASKVSGRAPVEAAIGTRKAENRYLFASLSDPRLS